MVGGVTNTSHEGRKLFSQTLVDKPTNKPNKDVNVRKASYGTRSAKLGASGGATSLASGDVSDLSNGDSKINFLESDPVSPCKGCKTVIGTEPGSKSLSCDRCEGLFHFSCSQLSLYEFEFFVKNPLKEEETKVNWFCYICKDELNQTEDYKSELIAKQSTQIEILSHQVGQMQLQLGQIMEFMQGNKKVDANIQNVVKEVVDDKKEKEEKKNNVILFNVPESTKTEVKDEIEEDTTHVNNILNHIDTRVSTDPDNITFIRLGLGKKLGLGTRPRPIKITFNNNKQKWSVLSNSSKLRESEDYKKINVSEDKTFQEQQTDKKLKKNNLTI